MKLLGSLEKKEYTCLNDFFSNSKVIALAVCLQNAQQPKNHHRTEAIQSKEYVEILTEDQATQFLNSMLRQNLQNEVLSVETKILAELQSAA